MSVEVPVGANEVLPAVGLSLDNGPGVQARTPGARTQRRRILTLR